MNTNEPAPTIGLSLPFTKAADPNATFAHDSYRMPLSHRIPDSIRNHFVAMCGEFVGTTLFLYFALSGTQVANSINSSAGLSVQQTGANPQQLQYISLCFGFSLAVFAWVFFRISGGLFNPAVTVGMCLIGALPWFRGALLFFTQILGGLAAAALVSCMFPGDLNVRTTLGGGTSIAQGLFIEMFLTAQLVFTIFMLAAEKHKGTFIAPVGIGLSLFIAELTGVFFTGGSLNPARSFGPAVVDHNFEGYHWIYWLGPILGALVAAGFFKFIKVLEYESANPGQDDEQRAAAIANAVHDEHVNNIDSLRTRDSHGTLVGNAAIEEKDQPLGGAIAGNNSNAVPTTTAGVAGNRAAGGFGAGLGPRTESTTGGFGAGVGGRTDGAATGFGAGVTRPEAVRNDTARLRMASPGMNTADNAFYGLNGGMHADERRPSNTRTTTAGQVV